MKVTRRGFVKAGATVAGAALMGDFLFSCTAGQKRHKVAMTGDKIIISLDEFPFLKEEWGGGIFTVGKKVGLVVVNTPDGYVAFKANCTHQQCVVDWVKEKKQFVCPCHKGTYDIDGSVVSGPPPEPLPRWLVAEEGGKLFITEA